MMAQCYRCFADDGAGSAFLLVGNLHSSSSARRAMADLGDLESVKDLVPIDPAGAGSQSQSSFVFIAPL